jgi:hypothetical protein
MAVTNQDTKVISLEISSQKVKFMLADFKIKNECQEIDL